MCFIISLFHIVTGQQRQQRQYYFYFSIDPTVAVAGLVLFIRFTMCIT